MLLGQWLCYTSCKVIIMQMTSHSLSSAADGMPCIRVMRYPNIGYRQLDSVDRLFAIWAVLPIRQARDETDSMLGIDYTERTIPSQGTASSNPSSFRICFSTRIHLLPKSYSRTMRRWIN